MSDSKINVVYLASGYPTADNLSHGIFNQRAVEAIRDHVNLTVIQYRIYRPGRKLCQKVISDGFKRIILCVPYSPVAEKRLFRFNNRMFYVFTKLYARAELKHADIVHASDGNLSVFAVWLKKKYRFKLLAQFIGGDLNQDLAQFYQKNWMRAWKEKLDAVSFNSNALKVRFNEMFGEHPLTKVIHRGVDTTKFFPSKNKPQGIVFYFLGGLPNYSTFTHGRNTKGGLNLLDAWAKLDSEGCGAKLLFAGPDSAIAVAKGIKMKLNHPDSFEIIGSIDPSAIADFHRSGNVALVPSLEEGLPNVAMEAASTGNLIIANAVGGIPELIRHKTNGILCETNDAEGLYRQMKWAMDNRDQIPTLGAAARTNMEMNFSSKDFGKKYVDYYREIITS